MCAFASSRAQDIYSNLAGYENYYKSRDLVR